MTSDSKLTLVAFRLVIGPRWSKMGSRKRETDTIWLRASSFARKLPVARALVHGFYVMTYPSLWGGEGVFPHSFSSHIQAFTVV